MSPAPDPLFTGGEQISLAWLRGLKHAATWNRRALPFLDAMWKMHFAGLDLARRAEGDALASAGFGPTERPYTLAATGPHWRLRHYAEADGPPLLIVASPIKKPYIWDLAPGLSAVQCCLDHALDVYLLEWLEPADGAADSGLVESVAAIVESAREATRRSGGRKPCLIGHSLGGTIAALAAARAPHAFSGLALLGAPLCFAPEKSRFRDALVAAAPEEISGDGCVPGSLLSYASAMASPQSFVWGRWIDAARSVGNRRAMDVHARIDRWSLDEAKLPARLVREIVLWLYRDNRFCEGTLVLDGRTIQPAGLDLPLLAVQNMADEVAPPASLGPALAAAPTRDVTQLTYPGEPGVALQHLGLLIGQSAHADLWPQILSWLSARG